MFEKRNELSGRAATKGWASSIWLRGEMPIKIGPILNKRVSRHSHEKSESIGEKKRGRRDVGSNRHPWMRIKKIEGKG